MVTEELVCGYLLAFVSSIILIGIVVYFRQRFSVCTEKVRAEIVGVEKRPADGVRQSHHPIYHYTYAGRDYQNAGFNSPTGIFPRSATIRINPDNPDDFIDLLALRRHALFLMPILILMFITGISGLIS